MSLLTYFEVYVKIFTRTSQETDGRQVANPARRAADHATRGAAPSPSPSPITPPAAASAAAVTVGTAPVGVGGSGGSSNLSSKRAEELGVLELQLHCIQWHFAIDKGCTLVAALRERERSESKATTGVHNSEF